MVISYLKETSACEKSRFKSKYPSAVGAIISLEICSVPGNTGTMEFDISVLFFIDKLFTNIFQLAIDTAELLLAVERYLAYI